MQMLDEKGRVVQAGDEVKCWANETWLFLRVLDGYTAEVAWDGQKFQMPVQALGCRVVTLPHARA